MYKCTSRRAQSTLVSMRLKKYAKRAEMLSRNIEEEKRH